jgi:hypothetical protein
LYRIGFTASGTYSQALIEINQVIFLSFIYVCIYFYFINYILKNGLTLNVLNCSFDNLMSLNVTILVGNAFQNFFIVNTTFTDIPNLGAVTVVFGALGGNFETINCSFENVRSNDSSRRGGVIYVNGPLGNNHVGL